MFVVHGDGGWDEPTPAAPFTIFDVRPGSREAARRGAPPISACRPASKRNSRAATPHTMRRACAAVLARRGARRSPRCARDGRGARRRSHGPRGGWRGRRETRSRRDRRRPRGETARWHHRLRQGARRMSGFLDRMAAASRARLEEARAREPLAALRTRALAAPLAPPLRSPGSIQSDRRIQAPLAGTRPSRRRRPRRPRDRLRAGRRRGGFRPDRALAVPRQPRPSVGRRRNAGATGRASDAQGLPRRPIPTLRGPCRRRRRRAADRPNAVRRRRLPKCSTAPANSVCSCCWRLSTQVTSRAPRPRWPWVSPSGA